MSESKFLEMLSELIVVEMEAVLKSSLIYENDAATAIVVLFDDETKLKLICEK